MKNFIFCLTLLTSIQSFACSATVGERASKFIAKLYREGRYDGATVTSTVPASITPYAELLRAHYLFDRSNEYNANLIECGEGADAQCRADEGDWEMVDNCLVVKGITVRILVASSNKLHFEYENRGRLHYDRFELISRGRLQVQKTITYADGSRTRIKFLGR